MTDLNQPSVSEYWNRVYKSMTNNDSPPLSFTDRIKRNVQHRFKEKGKGLYAGCGDGRNYIPLSQSGLDIIGLDISSEGLNRLARKNPKYAHQLICADFEKFEVNCLFDYIISIQFFHMAVEPKIISYVAKVAQLLKPSGLLFLRATSTGTQITTKHTITEQNTWGGFTIEYTEGEHKGRPIHYFSQVELDQILGCNGLYITFSQKVECRSDQKRLIVMWEIIAKKNGQAVRNNLMKRDNDTPEYIQTNLLQYL